MGADVEVTRLIELGVNDEGKIVMKGLSTDGGTSLITLAGANIDFLLNTLAACEVELKQAKAIGDVAAFIYSGCEIKAPGLEYPGLATLILKCLPERSLYFLLSANSLADLAKHCSIAAKSPLLSSDRRPS